MFNKGKGRHIKIGELQESDLSEELKLLYIRDLNSISKALEYCEQNQYEWLSFPNAVGELGLEKLIELLPGVNDVHFQKNPESLWGVEERVTTNMLFNTYAAMQIMDESKKIDDDNIITYIGHNLPLDSKQVLNGDQNSFKQIAIDPYLVARECYDMSENFSFTGWDGILWTTADAKGELGNQLFQEHYDKIMENYALTKTVNSFIPDNKMRSGVLSVTKGNSPSFCFTIISHKFEEFADYFLIKELL